jgi:(2R)-ethylmalonyl-CoA mutase
MTINAPAAWLLSLYVALADEQGATARSCRARRRTTSSRNICRAAPTSSRPSPDAADRRHDRLVLHAKRRNGTRSTSAAITCRKPARRPNRSWPSRSPPPRRARHGESGGQVPEKDFTTVFGRISFFVNAGIRFVTEMCKMRAFVDLWEEIGRERYGVTDEKHGLMFRYGVQVNSLGLTEQQPENNVYRILSRCWRSRCRNAPAPRAAAAGLERGARPAAPMGPAMVAAPAADPGLRDRPARVRRHLRRLQVVDAKVESAEDEARAMLASSTPWAARSANIDYMKHRLVESQRARLPEIEAGRRSSSASTAYETTKPRRSPAATARSWRPITARKPPDRR